MKKIIFYKYQGTGNDFVVIDNRSKKFPTKHTKLIEILCNRHFGIGADGLILLEQSKNKKLKMIYFNSNGNESTMCGNGGRCFVAFAKKLKLFNKKLEFDAVDGKHEAEIKGNVVKLKMIDVKNIDLTENHYFLNTGSPHHVEFTDDLERIDIQEKGSKIRYGMPYLEEGTNVNFVEKKSDNTIKVRTYERGVEAETLSCGTGVIAAVLAASEKGLLTKNHAIIETKGGTLEVVFKKNDKAFEEIYLKGEAKLVFSGKIRIEEIDE